MDKNINETQEQCTIHGVISRDRALAMNANGRRYGK